MARPLIGQRRQQDGIVTNWQRAIIVADNMIRPGGEGVAAYGRAVRATPGMRSILVPVGSGLEISRLE